MGCDYKAQDSRELHLIRASAEQKELWASGSGAGGGSLQGRARTPTHPHPGIKGGSSPHSEKEETPQGHSPLLL